MSYKTFIASRIVGVLVLAAASLLAGQPKVGQKAPDFELRSIAGERVRLSEAAAGGPAALIVLRGYPGYQCPACSRQVHDLIQHAAQFQEAGAPVLLVYPGPSDDLQSRAEEFVQDKTLPEGITLLLDPDYEFTNLYGLRWDAPKETAYPSTFVLDADGVITFRKISDSHGGRTTASEVLAEIGKL